MLEMVRAMLRVGNFRRGPTGEGLTADQNQYMLAKMRAADSAFDLISLRVTAQQAQREFTQSQETRHS